ncbi:MAG: hypothetical protein QXM22_00275 [Candidatus Bathyarchaeia archaeon]
MRVERFIGLAAVILGVGFLVFAVFANFYAGKAYWGNGYIVGYEYPFMRYVVAFLVTGSVMLVAGLVLLGVLAGLRRQGVGRTNA